MKNYVTAVFVALLIGLSGAASADVPVSAEQVELCYELGERGPYYRECKTEGFLSFVKACGITPKVTIDPRLMKALPNGVTTYVDELLAPLVSQCDPEFYRKARDMIRAKVKGVHLELVPLPPKDSRGNYPRTLKFQDGILEEGLFALPKDSSGYMSAPPMDHWVWEQVLGNPDGTQAHREEAEIANRGAEATTEPPAPTPEQKKRIAKLLTRQGGGGTAGACKLSGYFCGKNDSAAVCCSGVCEHGVHYDKCR